MGCRVYKFGGASVKNEQGFKNVAEICRQGDSSPLIVVLSALGKTTNAMEEVVSALSNEGVEAARLRLQPIIDHHVDIAKSLAIDEGVVLELFSELSEDLSRYEALPYDSAYDQIVCYGELTSTRMLSEYFGLLGTKAIWIDARRIIATNDIHRDATVAWDITKVNVDTAIVPLLEEGSVVVSQGFIGGCNDMTTTLGREGSDYSAAIMAYCLDAEDLTIWKDVPGVLTGDPRVFENVVKMDRLSYREAIEMTYYGAKVIHPKTIKPLQNKTIRLVVRSFEEKNNAGTTITDEVEVAYPPIVVVEKDQSLLHISTRDFSFVAEHHMSLIFNLISTYRIKVNMMRNTAISFTVCVTDAGVRLTSLVDALSEYFNVQCDQNLELITIRHYHNADLRHILGSRTVIFEEKIKDTLQMVVMRTAGIKRKEDI